MDAIEFVKEEIRMCASCQDCTDCSLYDTAYCSVSPKKRTQKEAEEIVQRVKKWSAAHPCKTKQSEFLKLYPETVLDENGVIFICPNALFSTYRNSNGGCNNLDSTCPDCRKEFWLKEVE